MSEKLAIKRWFPFSLLGEPILNFYEEFLLIAAFKKLYFKFTDIFACLLLSWSKRYSTSTTRNFNNSWLLYLSFSNMIGFCPNIWLIEHLKCQQFLFWKKNRQKTQTFHFFRGLYFVMAGPIDWMLACFERLLRTFWKV